jgi:iron(III) transport system ATP-binding protein
VSGHVVFERVSKAFGPIQAVDDLTLEVPRGSFATLLGPSGCGKTTLLRILAGFLNPDRGSVRVAGRDMSGLTPDRRPVGLVFQDYALFPHLTVAENLAYGLRCRRARSEERRRKVAEVAGRLHLEGLLRRHPHELSGGQQQRVALGRVLVLEPEVLLMDEPLSALDARLRLRIRGELKELQRRLGITTVYVTHDQEEALSLSDQVAVLDQGRLQQFGTPADVYRRPRNRFTADFVGQANLVPAEVIIDRGDRVEVRFGAVYTEVAKDARLTLARGDQGTVLFRPESLKLGNADGGWTIPGRVAGSSFLGSTARVEVETADELGAWTVDVPSAEGPSSGEVTVSALSGTGWWLQS